MAGQFLAGVLLAAMVTLVLLVVGCGTGSTGSNSSPTSSGSASSNQTTTTAPTPQTLSTVDGWTITLIPGTDQMRAQLEQSDTAGQSNKTMSMPAPPTFDPSVAVDGDRVVYSALYDKMPQVYLYDIASGEVTQLTNDAPANYLEQLQVQISGDWVAWQRGYNTNPIYLRNLATGEIKQFTPHQTVLSWRLVGNRLAWEETGQLHDAQLYLYDSAVGSVQTIAAAHGLLVFDMDNKHIAWAGGPDWNELYLYDLASGATRKVAQDSQQNGESIVIKGNILAWTGRTGDLTTLVVYRLDTGEQKVVDQFGPFNPEPQSDGRYLAWNRGEEATGTEVRVYDTETRLQIKLGDVKVAQDSWPSIQAGRIAWTRTYPPGYGEVIMVRDLLARPQTQLTNSPWIDQPPSVNGGHVVWARRNSDPQSSAGRGIFVATHAQP